MAPTSKNDTTCLWGVGSSKHGFDKSKGKHHVLDISTVCGSRSELCNARDFFRSTQDHESGVDGSWGYSSFVVGQSGLAQDFREMSVKTFTVNLYRESVSWQ
jgi:hypothetical protein